MTQTQQTMANGKSVKFQSLAEKRVSKVLRTVGQIGNLSGHSYEYEPEQVAEMFKAMRDALDAAETKFQPRAQPSFRFQAAQ